MPIIDKTARFVPAQRPGYGTFSLLGCKSAQELGADCKDKLSLLVVRSHTEEPLADWVSPNVDKFLDIVPEKAMQRGQDFEFMVGPQVVNPMAYDNNLGDYSLKIKCADGIIRAYKIAVQGQPRPSAAYTPPQQPTDPSFKATAPNMNANGAAGTTTAGATATATPRTAAEQRAANAAQTQQKLRTGTSLVRIFGIVGVILVLGLLLFFFRDSFLGKDDGAAAAEPPVAQSTQDPAKDTEASDSKTNTAEEANAGTAAGDDDAGATKSTDSGDDANAKADTNADASATTNNGAGDATNTDVTTKVDLGVGTGGTVGGGGNKSSSTLIASQACRIVEGLDDRTIINNCLASQPNDTHLMQLLTDALKEERCEIALRLLRSKGRANNGGIYAYVYATFADPQSAYRSSCIIKSAEDASYWTQRAKGDQSFTDEVAQKLLEHFKAYQRQ